MNEIDRKAPIVRSCPICGKPVEPAFKPFCSKRCANIDLNRWLSGVYAVPAKDDEDEDGERPAEGETGKKMSAQSGDWPDRLFETLKRGGIQQVAYVPDAGHARLIDRCRADDEIRDVALTTEEEGVALAAGAWLGGDRAALLMQSSGVGNCINMLSLARTCRFPLLMLITMRGEWEEFNPWQVPMGSITDPVLKLCEAEIYRANEPNEVAGIAQCAIQHVFGGERIAAVILSQQLIGKKVWTK